MIEVKDMSESDLYYRLEQVRDQIRECRRRIQKFEAAAKENENAMVRFMREEIVLKEAAKNLKEAEHAT